MKEHARPRSVEKNRAACPASIDRWAGWLTGGTVQRYNLELLTTFVV